MVARSPSRRRVGRWLVRALLLAAAVGGTVPVEGVQVDASGSVDGRPPERGPASTPHDLATRNATYAASAVTILSAYPNPIAEGDSGEFVVVRLPKTAFRRGSLTLSDGETTVSISLPAARPDAPSPTGGSPPSARRSAVGSAPTGEPSETVVVTSTPAAVGNLTPAGAAMLAVDSLALSNAGERLRVLHDGTELATLAYEDAPEGRLLVARDGRPAWRRIGYEPRPVRHHGPACATAFVLPDSPEVPLATVREATRRLFLAGYTFGSERVTTALIAAHRRGVDVRVLLDADPVGGVTTRQRRLLDRLAGAGVDVRLLGGPGARFDFHHPKYAVVDDTAIVATENWKPAGTGGADSRGWGVRVRSRAVAADLAGLFRSDAGWRDARPWATVRGDVEPEPIPAANGSYPQRFAPERVAVRNVSVVTAPGNAERAVVSLIDGADRRVLVEQPSVGGLEHAFVRACLRAARRGVRVRILLSSAQYVESENRQLVTSLNDRAAASDLPLTARLADPAGRFGKIHAKGLVVDDTALVGSLNWNDNSVSDNREVALALHSPPAAAYYAAVFRADWDRRQRVPVGLLVVVVVAVGVSVAVVRRRVSFASVARRGSSSGTAPVHSEPAGPPHTSTRAPAAPRQHDGVPDRSRPPARREGPSGRVPATAPGGRREPPASDAAERPSHSRRTPKR